MRAAEGPNLDRLYSIRKDGSRRKLHPADVHGQWVTRRRIVVALLIAIYVAMPLVPVGGHPALHLDVAARRFYLVGGVFDARDVWRALFLMLAFAFSLLLVTAWLGRGWCGWACPQTVFMEGVFRPIERLVEGPGAKRLRLDAAPWSAGKLARRVVKHALFIGVCLAIAHVALSVVVSSRTMLGMLRDGPAAHLEAFAWTTATAALLYFDFGWFREQTCIALCPYGRLQSVLLDRDSLVIGYDGRRGEPRTKAAAGHAKREGAGDCVDCGRCVVVCPTGIDIRAGLQMECVACAQCIDACDDVMDKLGRPRGLVRYDAARVFDGEARRKKARPRVIAYLALTLAALGGLVATTVTRRPIDAVLLRQRGAPYVLDGGDVRNAYELHLVNKTAAPIRFSISGDSPGVRLVIPAMERNLAPLESARIPVFASMERGAFHGPFDLGVRVIDDRTSESWRVGARFLGPTN